MNILDTIIASKRMQVAHDKVATSVQELEKRPFFQRQSLSLQSFLLDTTKTGIISEFKRKSPSKGVINGTASVTDVTRAYTAGGASGLSILTDTHFFGGTNHDLKEARINNIPILRKDFIIDEYQIIEARSIGADVVLLIAANLSPKEVKQLAAFAKSLQLEVLLELHTEHEMVHVCDEVDLIGINNRNLKNFEVNLEHSIQLAEKLPKDKLKIAESGISSVETVLYLREQGFHGFLMGEYFMRQADPAQAFADFAKALKQS